MHQGNVRSANLVEGFIPLYQSAPDTLSFADIRVYNPSGTPLEGNIDLGLRHVFHQGARLFGLYAGYDRYRSETRRYYNQANAGIEFWNNRLFLGGNIYVPFGTKVYDNDSVNLAYLVSADVNNDYRYNISYAQGKERVMPGIDAEIGYDFTPSLTVYGGGYYFDHSAAKSIAGPKLRATYTFYRSNTYRLLKLFDRIRLEGLISHDSVRGTSWMAGLRFRFGLSKRANPNQGLARHMTDPIRRDLNVVSENFNASAEPYIVDGQRIRVDLVDNGTNRTLNQAINGSNNNAEVIGVLGNQDLSSSGGNIDLGGRELTITGGNFDFNINGHPYTVYNLGNKGRVTAVSGTGLSLFTLDNEAQPITLEHLKLFADDDQFALTNNGASFAHLIIDDVQTDAPIILKLDSSEANSTGQLTFINNTITLMNSTAMIIHAGADLGGLVGVGLFVTSMHDQQMTVYAFKNNTINITNDAEDFNWFSLDAESLSSNPILFVDSVHNNHFILENNNSSTATDNCSSAVFYKFVKIAKNLSNNYISAIGYGGDGSTTDPRVGMVGLEIIDSELEVIGDISGNRFIATNYQLGPLGGNAAGWLIADDGVATIGGNINGNTFNASHSSGRGYNILTGFPASGKGQGILNVTGNLSGNNFIVTHNVGNNTLSGVAIRTNGKTTFGGKVENNHFEISENDLITSAMFVGAPDTITFADDILNNRFDFKNNGENRAIWLGTTTDFGGFIKNNVMTFNESDTSNSTGFYIDITSSSGTRIITFQQSITDNFFKFNNTNTDYGVFIVTSIPGGNSVNFDGNENSGELSSSNGDTKVSPLAQTTGINYGG